MATEFLTEFYGIWNDFAGCLDCVWCSSCYVGRQMNAVEDVPNKVHWPTCLLAALCCPLPCLAFSIRRRVVTKYSLVEPPYQTNCIGLCFFPLSLCQTMRELGLRDAEPGGTCCVSTPSIC